MKQLFKIILLAIVFGALAGSLSAFIILNLQTQNQEDLIKDFYLTENAVHVSPHGIRKAMDKGDQSFILVDLRSQEEYEEEHITGAVSIPAYKNRDTSAYDDVERIVREFEFCCVTDNGCKKRVNRRVEMKIHSGDWLFEIRSNAQSTGSYFENSYLISLSP